MKPPPISGENYPVELGAEARTNYLGIGFIFSGGYIDNLYPGGTATAVGEETYSIFPTITWQQSGSRHRRIFRYSPGFTFYEPTHSLDETDQSALLSTDFRLTPHSTLSLSDSFERSSTAYNFAAQTTPGFVSGSLQPQATGVVPPFAQRLGNDAEGGYVLQTSRTNMIGASGISSILHFPNSKEVQGLYDSNSRGGSGFYNHQISATQYIGINYQYLDIVSYPPNEQSETHTHTIYPFYSVYPVPKLSVSISGGPEYFTLNEPGVSATKSWEPSFMGSAAWLGTRTSVSGNYTREVTAGGGLLGAFDSNIAGIAARWRMSRVWSAGLNGSYSIYKTAGAPSSLVSNTGGHGISGTLTVSRIITEHVSLDFEYDRTHQSYSGIQAIANNPNSDRVMASLAWQFRKPLGQ